MDKKTLELYDRAIEAVISSAPKQVRDTVEMAISMVMAARALDVEDEKLLRRMISAVFVEGMRFCFTITKQAKKDGVLDTILELGPPDLERAMESIKNLEKVVKKRSN